MMAALERLTLAAIVLIVAAVGILCMAGGAIVGAVCALAGWYPLPTNLLLSADMGGNVFPLLGRPGETISHRVARMRAYGGERERRLGCALCAALSAAFWFQHRDHCSFALDSGPEGTEPWRWSKLRGS